jgi:hypothetical protein
MIYMITLGQEPGLHILNEYARLDKDIGDLKVSNQDLFMNFLRNNEKAKKALQKQKVKMGALVSCCGCISCVPCGRQPQKVQKRHYVQV